MQVDPLPEIGDVLRCFVRNSRDVVLINQHRGGMALRFDLLNVNHGAVRYTANSIEPDSPLFLQVVSSLGFAFQEGITGKCQAGSSYSEGINTQRNHENET